MGSGAGLSSGDMIEIKGSNVKMLDLGSRMFASYFSERLSDPQSDGMLASLRSLRWWERACICPHTDGQHRQALLPDDGFVTLDAVR